MTAQLIPIRALEDKRLAQRAARAEATRRKLLPLVVIVCETYGVMADDLLDSQNKHPTLVMARDIVRWLGWSKLHVGTSHLAAAMNQARSGAAGAMPRIKKKLASSEAFREQVAMIEALLDAAVKR